MSHDTTSPSNAPATMTEERVASFVSELLLEQPDRSDAPLDAVSTLKRGEIEGLLLRFGDGSEFQLRIVRSR